MQSFQDVKLGSHLGSWQDQGMFDANAGLKRMRDDDDENDDDENDDDDKGDGTRSKYKCGLCGQVDVLPLELFAQWQSEYRKAFLYPSFTNQSSFPNIWIW